MVTSTHGTPVSGPRAILVIRHGEKPPDAKSVTGSSGASSPTGPPYGVDINGDTNPDSLIPQGWQRAGALASLFDPTGHLTELSGLATPTVIATPNYGKPQQHRTYQTVFPTALKLRLTPVTDFAVGQETQLVDWVLGQDNEIVLICWEHDHIIDITGALQKLRIVTGPVPGSWPRDRFDIVIALWPGTDEPGSYLCSQVPQLLLAGDSNAPIPPAAP